MKIVFIILSSVLLSVSLSAQDTEDSILDSISARFMRQSILFPQEKIYAQIDKPYYITGETIWFRAHLTDAMSHVPDTTSRYIYAELINPDDSIISRVKVRPENGAYGGHIVLPEDIAEGEYQLRCYTRFMENIDESYFFKRKVSIGDPLTALYRTEASFEYEDEEKKKIVARIQFMSTETGKSIVPEKIIVKDEKGRLKSVKADKEGIVWFAQKTSPEQKQGSLYVEYNYLGKFHKQYIPIHIPDDDFHVDFFPEGGKIVANTSNRVAFKALNQNGLGEEIEGTIVTEAGAILGSIKSEHLGMGSFFINSTPAGKLYAICRNSMNIEKRFELPAAVTDEASLSTLWKRDRLYVQVRKPDNSVLSDSLYLVIHCRGLLLNAIHWDKSHEYVVLEQDKMPLGPIHILLVDSHLNPISERLVFNMNKSYMTKHQFSTDKPSYKMRERVKASVNITDSQDMPVFANLSVSVTDDKDIQPDSCVNILTSMLLTSDLRGYIESPALYFKQDNNTTISKLDLLMMTQGWRRYNIANVLHGDIERPKTIPEFSQSISGTVKGGILMTKGSAGYPVTALSTNHQMILTAITNEKGRFTFDYFELPDSASYIIQGQTKKGGSRVELTLDEELFPKPGMQLPPTLNVNRNAFEDYMGKADQKYTMENGMRMIYLQAVEITAKKTERKNKLPYSSEFNTFISSERLQRTRYQDIFQALQTVAGVRVTNRQISIRNMGTPLILIDGIETEEDMLSSLQMDDVAEIEVAKDAAGTAIFGMRGANGVIMITTKIGDGGMTSRPMPFNLKTVTPLGYQISKEFYSPKYETKQQKEDATPDLRTTIFWSPSIKTVDDGKASFEFYTADASTSYSVVIEGVTAQGQLIYAIEKIDRKTVE